MSTQEAAKKRARKRNGATITIVIAAVGALLTGLTATGAGPSDVEVGRARFQLVAGLKPAVTNPEAIGDGLGMSEFRDFAPRGEVEAGLVIAGIAHGEGPSLFPAGVRLQQAGVSQLDRLGAYLGVRSTGYVTWRSAGTSDAARVRAPRAQADKSQRAWVVVYSMPVLAPISSSAWTTVEVACAPGTAPVASALVACEEFAATLDAHEYGEALGALRRQTYAQRLSVALQGYYASVPFVRGRLAAAHYSDEQAKSADQLAHSYRVAEQLLAPLPADPIALPALRRLQVYLHEEADDFALLARAATVGDARAWALASRHIALADVRVATALQDTEAA